MNELTHFNENNEAHMVDISIKPPSTRTARASGFIHMSKEAISAINKGTAKKGDVLGIARIAAIQAAKQTSFLIPLCHKVPLSHIRVDFDIDEEIGCVKTVVSATSEGKTGVEMEALTGVNIALLTIYDMLKALDKNMVLTHIHLEEKSGGKSGDFIFSNKFENLNY